MSCSLELYFINLLRYEYCFKASEANRHHKTSFSFALYVMYRDVSVALRKSRMGGSPTCVTVVEICLYTFS